MRHVKEGADWTTHAMNQRYGGIGEGKPSLHGSEHHAFARLTVVRLKTGDTKVACDNLDRGQS